MPTWNAAVMILQDLWEGGGGRKVETKEKLRKITTILLVLLHLQVKHKTKIIHTTLSYKNRQ